jgi:cobaltochelatase CobT
MTEVPSAVRQQQRVEALCAATIRALCGQRDLHFRGQRLHHGRQRLRAFAPHLHPRQTHDDVTSFRGAADGLALRLRWSSEELHRRLAPTEPVRRMLFDMLEQFRVESLAADDGTGLPTGWPGLRRNLRHRFEQWALTAHHSGLSNTARGLLLLTVALMCRARVTAEPVVEALEDRIESTRAGIGPLLGPGLGPMRHHRHHQALYAQGAWAVADAVARLLEASGDGQTLRFSTTAPEPEARTASGFLVELDEPAAADTTAAVVLGRSRQRLGSASGYRVYTTAYDRVLRPAAHMRRAQLDEFRQQLDARVAAQGLNLNRLARQLKAVLAQPARDGWVHAQEEGVVDGRALAQLVASPAERRLFRQELQEPQADATVTLLIDCSGSMRQHMEHLALLADVLTRALDMAGISSEVLGYSTGAWNGGRAVRDWQRDGRPAHPGRLAETAQFIFKEAHTPWRHARRDIAALLRPDLYREGVDGEALVWAAARLRARSERRKLLVAVSDGCPMEAATQQANDEHYLDHHLQQVAGGLEADGDLELAALGVGLDLSPYYRRCQVLDLQHSITSRVLNEVLLLLAGRGCRHVIGP